MRSHPRVSTLAISLFVTVPRTIALNKFSSKFVGTLDEACATKKLTTVSPSKAPPLALASLLP